MGGRVDFEADNEVQAAEVVLDDTVMACAALHATRPARVGLFKPVAEPTEAGNVFARFRLGSRKESGSA